MKVYVLYPKMEEKSIFQPVLYREMGDETPEKPQKMRDFKI